jgi:hypothetical protein
MSPRPKTPGNVLPEDRINFELAEARREVEESRKLLDLFKPKPIKTSKRIRHGRRTLTEREMIAHRDRARAKRKKRKRAQKAYRKQKRLNLIAEKRRRRAA